jgi:hypothetical protein
MVQDYNKNTDKITIESIKDVAIDYLKNSTRLSMKEREQRIHAIEKLTSGELKNVLHNGTSGFLKNEVLVGNTKIARCISARNTVIRDLT